MPRKLTFFFSKIDRHHYSIGIAYAFEKIQKVQVYVVTSTLRFSEANKIDTAISQRDTSKNFEKGLLQTAPICE